MRDSGASWSALGQWIGPDEELDGVGGGDRLLTENRLDHNKVGK
jgi:hypothetical protein